MNASAARILNAGTLRVLLNLAVFQAAWFACVGFAARGAADWGIAAIAAFFGLSNRMANVTNMRPNDEFYLMGRLPK